MDPLLKTFTVISVVTLIVTMGAILYYFFGIYISKSAHKMHEREMQDLKRRGLVTFLDPNTGQPTDQLTNETIIKLTTAGEQQTRRV